MKESSFRERVSLAMGERLENPRADEKTLSKVNIDKI